MFVVSFAARLSVLLIQETDAEQISESMEALELEKVIAFRGQKESSLPLKKPEFVSYAAAPAGQDLISAGLELITSQYVVIAHIGWEVDAERLEKAFDLMETSKGDAVAIGVEPSYQNDRDATTVEGMRLETRARAFQGLSGVIWSTQRLTMALRLTLAQGMSGELASRVASWAYQLQYTRTLQTMVPCFYRVPGVHPGLEMEGTTLLSLVKTLPTVKSFLGKAMMGPQDAGDAFQMKRGQQAASRLLTGVLELELSGNDFSEFEMLHETCEALEEAIYVLQPDKAEEILQKSCEFLHPGVASQGSVGEIRALSTLLIVEHLSTLAFLRSYAQQGPVNAELLICFSPNHVGSKAATALRNIATQIDDSRTVEVDGDPSYLDLVRAAVKAASGTYVFLPDQATTFSSGAGLYFMVQKLSHHAKGSSPNQLLSFAGTDRRIAGAEVLQNPASEVVPWLLNALVLSTKVAKMALRHVKYDFTISNPTVADIAFIAAAFRAAAQEVPAGIEVHKTLQSETLQLNALLNEGAARDFVLHQIARVTQLANENEFSAAEREALVDLFAYQAKIHLWAAELVPSLQAELKLLLQQQGVEFA